MLGEPNEKKSNMDDVEGLKVDPRFVHLHLFSSPEPKVSR